MKSHLSSDARSTLDADYLQVWYEVPNGRRMTGVLEDGNGYQFKQRAHVQGDHAGCIKPHVDTKTKVAFLYNEHILKWNFCFDVNGRFDTT